MRFVIDDKIPYIKGVMEHHGKVLYKPGASISREDVRDADALIIRTRTKCNKDLFEGSSVKFIATATIGFDHIDTDYCDSAGIKWANAPGCNAESVNQYVASALSHWAEKRKTKLEGKTIGIIGVGNVGSRVAKTADILGMNTLLNDPPRARKEGSANFVDLRHILQEADIISMHVPLNMEGIDKTFQMANECFFESWKKPDLFINTCRGEVMDSGRLMKRIGNGKIGDCIIDCWENEPDIDHGLLNMALIGTPHIAGYSRDGKANGTSQSIQALSRFFSLGLDNWYPDFIEDPYIPNIILDGTAGNQEDLITSAIQSTYDIKHDDRTLREKPQEFEKLRGDYPVRREFHAYQISCKNIHQDTIKKLKTLGFHIE